ncbi:MAG: hypothetical protein GXP42_05430 [Chloroflexi bacterium]|nr:hypothetical protein [Chloroflexota bacterium]
MKAKRLLVATFALALLAVGALWLVRPQSEPSASPFQLPNELPDLTVAAPGASADKLTPRPTVSPELKAMMNRSRGRPPLLAEDVPDLRRDWFWSQRIYPADSAPVDANIKALEKVREQGMSAQSMEQTWQSLGPNSIENGIVGLYNCTQYDCNAWRTNVSGRTKAIVFHPQNPNIIYIATAVGGLWKSTDGGNSFTPLTADQPSHAFHSLALDPTNPNIIYAGTGEIQGYYGVGLLKSTDGGQSWTLLGKDIFKGLVISAIVVHPTNPSTIYVATSIMVQPLGQDFPPRGVFRSTDGGQTWTALAQCERCYGISDLVMADNNPQVLYAGVMGAGVLKTTDGGQTWTWLSNGLPDRGFNRVELAIGRGAQSNVLYAGLDARVNVGGRVEPWGLIYKTTDGGQSWTLLQNAPNYCSSQCGYDNIIAVHPTNANIVYIGGNLIGGDPWRGVVHKTTDGGQTWQDLTPGTANNKMVHPDMHAITFKPGNPNEVWIGNDGGVFRSTDGGQTWEHVNANLNTLQFIGLGVHPTNPNIAFGGLQDNAKAKFDGARWVGLDTGDGGFSAIDPFDPNIWYGTRFSISGSVIQFQRNDKGGTPALADWQQKANGIDINDRVLFYVPFTLDPSTPGVIYLGTHRLYRTADRGDSWQAISGDLTRGADTRGAISAIAVAPNDPNTIYTGSSDGIVSVTSNRGGQWSNITGNLPNRYVSDIAVSPTSAATAYVVFNGYNTHTPNTPGHVFKTTDRGQSWQNISSNLPDIPVLSIALDPKNPGTIYIGTDIGVFRTVNDGASWTFFNQGLATVPVVELVLNNTTRQLWAATGGRGVFRLNLGGAGPTPTPTPTTGPLTQRLWMPMMRRLLAPTPPPPPSGPRPGQWKGDKAEFAVTSDQKDVWNLRIFAPVPGCPTWVASPAFSRIQQNGFSFEVNLGANGFWSGQGTFSSGTQASGKATFQNVYFGTSCGTWSGEVNWTATWQSGGADPTATPTPTPRPPTPTPSSTTGIYGQVRYKDVGIGGVTLWLRRCPTSGACDFEASKVASAVTDANGYYQFANVPTLPANHYYFVYYFNHGNGDNTPNDKYLWRWFGPNITSYSAGQSVKGGDFDIANIALTGPRAERTTLPASFTWESRSIAGEHYAWTLFDLDTGKNLCFSIPSTNPSFQLTESDFLNGCNGQYGKKYGWYAWALAGSSWDNNQGFGDSYYYAAITFESSGGPTATPTPTHTPTFTPTPQQPTATPTPDQGLTISGYVRANGVGASGLAIQLLGCASSSCSVLATTTTGSGGYYDFTHLTPPGPGESYRVRYVNGPEGGNSWNPNHLYYWVTGPITNLKARSPQATASFDVGDVALLSPPHNYSGNLPIPFSWQGRGIGGDYYAWALHDGFSELCYQNPPSMATNFTLDLTGATNCGLFLYTPYNWYVYVTEGPGFNQGFGRSGYYRTFTVIGAAGARERRIPGKELNEMQTSPLDLPKGLIPTGQP